MDVGHLLARVEWEPLRAEQEWRLVEASPHLPQGSETLTARRDDSYHVDVTLSGRCMSKDAGALRAKLDGNYLPGDFARGPDVTVEAIGGAITIAGYLPRGYSFEHPDWDRIEFTVPVYTNRVRWKRGEGVAMAWFTEWFLNGPHDSPWRRTSDRSFETQHTRRWGTPTKHSSDFVGAKSGGGGVDHFLLQGAGIDAVVHAVPKGLAPEWSNSVGISYFGAIPAEEVRNGLEELLGLVFGRRLMKVATVAFDAAGFAVEEEIVSPWGTDVKGPCGRPDWSILPLSFAQGGSSNVEDVVMNLLPQYLELREKLRLDDVLWRLWLGQEAPTTIDVPIFASGLEILAGAWFKASKSRSKGKYLPKEQFDGLLGDELKTASEKLKNLKFGDRMLRKLQGAFETSGNERLRWFFDEIELPVGSMEEDALKARNQAVHPTRAHTAEEQLQFVRMANVYRMLMVRAVLKVLSWNGPYMDYGAVGHPIRALDEPSGGAKT